MNCLKSILLMCIRWLAYVLLCSRTYCLSTTNGMSLTMYICALYCCLPLFKQMGYNPFKPHMSFAAGSSGAATATSSASASAGGSAVSGGGGPSPTGGVGQMTLDPTLDQDQDADLQAAVAEAEESTVAEVDDAFAMLLSLGTNVGILYAYLLSSQHILGI